MYVLAILKRKVSGDLNKIIKEKKDVKQQNRMNFSGNIVRDIEDEVEAITQNTV